MIRQSRLVRWDAAEFFAEHEFECDEDTVVQARSLRNPVHLDHGFRPL
jgi:hypothetical protein